jgi:3-phenylpropionate/trans-cinnamate dioxygenase ferredoxin reductase subunit
MDAGIVIVGAGETGARAASALRENGFDGAITLIGDEEHPPYERPPLSKAVMHAEEHPPVPRIGHTLRFDEWEIAHEIGQRAVAIDQGGRLLKLADGSVIPYAKLLIATGAKPRKLAMAGGDALLYLRTFADALVLRSHLEPGRRLAVIGGGFIGLEIAASARQRGCAVTVIEAAPRILMRGVPAEIAEVVAARHRAEGVALLTGTGLDRLEKRDDGVAVILADGSEVLADGIIAGIGALPETSLAAAAGLALDNGVAVDSHLRTADEHIFAAGDCCSFPHPLYGGRRIRLEAWRNAQDQGAYAAKAMMGASEEYAAVPWFWSDQYDLHLQIAGLADEGKRMVMRDQGEGARIYFHLDDAGRLVAASAVGPIGRVARDMRLAEMLVAKRAHPDPAALAAPETKLKALLAA